MNDIQVRRRAAKVLVTGANGFLGPALVKRLLAHGYREIRCFVRSGADRTRLDELRSVLPDSNLDYFEGELSSEADSFQALDGIDTVFHLAAGLRGSPADMFWNSVVCSKRMLSVIKPPSSLRIVLVSSFGVYGVAPGPRRSILDESTPLEPHPELRDSYSYGKWRQELLFREYQERLGFELVIVRPGVIYGPGGSRFSPRVGLNLPGLFLHCGHGNVLPLTYVDNCAEAIVVAGSQPNAVGQAYNVHDDDLPTARAYLKQYKRQVKRFWSLPLPYFAAIGLSHVIEKYHRFSKGQLPAFLTPYRGASLWRGNRFSNEKLKSLGWRPLVTTQEGLRRTFEYFLDEDRRKMHEAV